MVLHNRSARVGRVSVGADRALVTLLISFGAGVEAPGCTNMCSEPIATGRAILSLSLIIYILPLLTLSVRRRIRIFTARLVRSMLAGHSKSLRASILIDA